MSELHLQTIPNQATVDLNMPSIEMGEVSELNSLGILNGLEQDGIPLEDKEGIAASLDTLRAEFGIEDDFITEPKAAIVMSAIADRHNRILKDDNLDSDTRLSEMEYVADLTMSVAGAHSKFKDEYKASTHEASVSDVQSKAAYEKFTQPEVTKDMDEFIRGPKFAMLRERLGVTEETPYEVKVLSIDSQDGSQAFGLVPSIDYSEQHSQAEFSAKVKEGEYRQDYVKGLRKNGKEFNDALGREGEFAPAWVTNFEDGTQYLCLALPTAEKVLYTDEERASYYTEDSLARDMAIVEHEYTHTQRMLLFGKNIGPGIALEELRAEHFSGNMQGYTDIKKFFTGIGVLTGYSAVKSFEIDGESYDESTFLSSIAKNLGLEGFLDCLTAIPKNYADDEQVNPYVKAIVAHNGGSLSAHFQRVIDRVKAQLGDDVVQANIDSFIDKMRDHFKGNEYVSVESYLHYGGITSLAAIGVESFRGRYLDESDNYDYQKS